ncbi:MAG: RIP metalloprotease RseP [Rickettsiales bacterium]|jgi:regulator of sigma E protease|nr:RIP metalloprotease RseP [Rickettsiales bacterium]
MELISTLLFNILSFVLVLTIIVFVHEFGHFWVARRAGVKVEVFSIGFGKELLGFNDKHGTRWKFCLIPMGGYIKMFGDKNSASQEDGDLIKGFSSSEKKMAFSCKSLKEKSAIVAAGPAANYLFSAIVFTFFFFIYGYPNVTTKITEVIENSPASKAGIYPGDVIEEINGNRVNSFDDIKNIMALNLSEDVYIKVSGQEIYKTVTPQKTIEKDALDNEVISYKLGIITTDIKIEEQNIFAATKLAILECYNLSVMTLKAMGQIVTGARSSKELGGPIKIAQYSAKSMEAGIKSLLWFMALLSINLGLINLFPIPVLDGGHLLIYLVEASFGKKIAGKIQNYGFQIGIILLLMLTIFVSLNDLSSLLK